VADNGVPGARHGVAEVRDGAHGQQNHVRGSPRAIAAAAGPPHQRPRGCLRGEVPAGVLRAERQRLAELHERRHHRDG